MEFIFTAAPRKANAESKAVDEYVIFFMGHGCHFNWDVDYCIFKYVLHWAALANHGSGALPLAELSGEPCTVLWAGGGERGPALYLLCALPFNLCSQQNEWMNRAAQHPRLQHPADDSAPKEGGGEKKNKCWREKGRSTVGERLKGEEKHRRSKSGKWKELSKHGCLPEDLCSCTKSGAVRPTLSKAVSERGEGAEEKKKWFEELISSLWTSKDGDPESLSVSWSNFTQEKCLWIPGLSLPLQRSEENRQKKKKKRESHPVGSERWNLIQELRLLRTVKLLSSSQAPLGPPSHLPAPGACLLCAHSHCSAVEHTHGRCQGKEHEMSDLLLNASRVSEKQVE